MDRSEELRPRRDDMVSSEPFSKSTSVGCLSPLTLRRLDRLGSFEPDPRRCSAHRRPLSTPVLRPTEPTVLATGEPMLRSRNSAPDLKRGEYDFELAYAETDPLIAEDIRGWVEVSNDKRGSGCDLESELEVCCDTFRGG